MKHDEEWHFRYTERLAILIQGDRPPTTTEAEIAYTEADEASRNLEAQ